MRALLRHKSALVLRLSGTDELAASSDFFKSPTCLRLYLQFLTTVLTRVNTVTGVAYSDDPTIFAWELINEPRAPQDSSGDVLQAWIERTSAHIKYVDATHMVTTGTEVRSLLNLHACGPADAVFRRDSSDVPRLSCSPTTRSTAPKAPTSIETTTLTPSTSLFRTVRP